MAAQSAPFITSTGLLQATRAGRAETSALQLDECLSCGAALDWQTGRCPRLNLSGIAYFDAQRVNCGHGDYSALQAGYR